MAAKGFNIFPLSPRTKRPLLPKEDFGGWQSYMTQDPETIRKWFESYPDMNYAVNPPRGFVILDPDYDPKKDKDGVEAFSELESKQDIEDAVMGETFTVRSPKGGQHLYLRTQFMIGNSQSVLAPGVDVRGFNGYVVGPGCFTDRNDSTNTAEGEYVIQLDGEMKECPKWVVDTIAGRDTSKMENADEPLFEYDSGNSVERARQWVQQQTEFSVDGKGGNHTAYQAFAFIHDFCVSPETAIDLLNEPYDRPEDEEHELGRSWNQRCVDSEGKSYPWSTEELEKLAQNAYKYAQNRPGTKGGLMSTMGEYAFQQAEEARLREQKDRYAALEASFFPGGTILDRTDEHDFIAPDWLPDYGFVQLIARREVGKTITAIDLALRCAGAGTPSAKFKPYDWYGTPLADDWAVLYIAGEDDWGVQKQINAWCKAHGTPPADDRFAVLAKNINLMDGEEIKAAAEFLKVQFGGRRVMIVLDTWQRATNTASQNDDVQMNLAVQNAEALARYLRGPIIALVHPPKHNQETASGSSVMENQTTAIWHIGLKNDQSTREMRVIRIKNAPNGKYVSYLFKEVDLGTMDRFGRKNVGVVVDMQASSIFEESPEAKGRNANAKALYATIIATLIMRHKEAVLDEKAKNSPHDFRMKNMADRIHAFFTGPATREEAEGWKKKLLAEGDKAAFGSSVTGTTLRHRLSDLFQDGRAVQSLDGKTWIALQGQGHGQKFVIDDAAAARHEMNPADQEFLDNAAKQTATGTKTAKPEVEDDEPI